MTGKNRQSSNWLNSSTVPAGLIVAEATWGSLLVNAIVNTSAGPHPHLPFLALAVPALVAVGIGGICSALRWKWWWRWTLTAALGLLGAALTAGVISQLSPGSAASWRVAFLPWTANDHRAIVIAAAVWFVALLAWIRGIWLAMFAPGFQDVVRSAALGAAAFVGVFAGRADSHNVAFRAVTGDAGWLLFLWFPLTIGVCALVRQRILELEVLRRTSSQPGRAWLMVLSIPMLGVALVALLLAVAVGPAAPVIGHAVARSAVAVGDGVASAARWLVNLIPNSHGNTGPEHNGVATRHTPVPPAPVQPKPSATAGTLPTWVTVILLVLAVAAIIYLLRMLIRRRPARPSMDAIEADERDSLFSWHHVAAQLLGALRELLGRLTRLLRRRARPVPVVGSTPAAAVSVEAQTVRVAYRRVLAAARAVGYPRAASETPRELQQRLSPDLALDAGTALDDLTGLYDLVRYGETDPDEQVSASAGRCADAVTHGLGALPARPTITRLSSSR